jgi:serine/threonine protein phosphatase 1
VRLFVVGDIHGSLEKLYAELQKLKFVFATDQLWAVGDLVDRGPRSFDVLKLLKEPWFNSILGNHEEMILLGYRGSNDHAICSLQNGGGWFPLLEDEDMQEAIELMSALPVVKTLQSPSGKKIGLIHGEPPTDDWDQIVAGIETPQIRDAALWGRSRVRRSMPVPPTGIANIDHVYCGHTPMKNPLTVANVSWIDTGACFPEGRLTVVEVL